MEEDRDEDLIRVAESICDGTPVDWETESTGRPDLEPLLAELRLLGSIAARHGVRPDELVLAGTALTSPPAAASGPEPRDEPGADPALTWGPLRLLERIGMGGFGEVYRAYDGGLRREVALKLVRPDRMTDARAERSFLDEARRLARVRHPNVLVVHGADRHDGRLGLWTDLVRGETLEALLQSHGPFSAEEATGIGLDLCRALAAVHAAGLIHRDVKTTNVMREQGGRIVLMDFGAMSELSTDPRPGDDPGAGTLLTMAPEQIRGEEVGVAADLYGLGVLLYRLVSGRFPMQAETPAEVRARRARGEFVPLRDVRPDIPAEFVQVVECALDPIAARRFQTAGAMEQALLRLGSTPRRAGEHAARPRSPAAWIVAGTVAAGLLVLFVIVGLERSRISSGALDPRSGPASDPERNSGAIGSSRNGGSVGTRESGNVAGRDLTSLTASAALYREQDGRETPLGPGDTVEPGDGLFLSYRGTEPSYVYVLDEDARGEVYVLFPAPGLDLRNPIAAGRQRLPGTRGGDRINWQVTSAGREETVIVIASRSPLPQLERSLREFPPATAENPVIYGRLDAASLGMRGIGGLTKPEAPASRDDPRLSPVVRSLLNDPGAPETPWVWQIQLQNPPAE
jgi:serine/threonine protein kinase